MTQHIKLKLTRIDRQTKDAARLFLDGVPAYEPGQFVTLIFNLNGEEVHRAYSLCSAPGEPAAVAVKRVEGGLVSNHLLDTVKEGETIDALPPAGTFIYKPKAGQPRDLFLWAGGSGITPLYSIAKTALQSEPDSAVHLIYTNRNIGSIIFRHELEQLAAQNDRFTVTHVLSMPQGTWQGPQGRITADLVKQLYDTMATPNTPKQHFVCGPDGMMETIIEALKSHAIDPATIAKESFKNYLTEAEKAQARAEAQAENPTDEITTRTVTFIEFDGSKHSFEVSPDRTILEASQDAGLDLPFSCQSGVCTACMCKKESGRVYMDNDDALSADEQAEGYFLTCVGHPLTSDLVFEAG